ncbi:MAG: hypothetical protein Q4F83_08290 [Eubacteriales bacterium]|nr:hypothetical protein [Eubacteriales bacterium]
MDHATKIYQAKRVGMTVFGIIVCGICVGFFKAAAFGVDPYQTLMSGLDAVIPLSFGTVYSLATAAMLLFALFADRHYIGLGTIINLLFLGYIAQFSLDTLLKIFPDPSVPLRILFLIIGIVFMCLSSAFYFTADMGVSTYDAVALILTNKWHLGKFKFIRIITDLVCVALGCCLYIIAGGKISALPAIAGAGTIITAFFMGPLIDFFNIHIARPFLNGKAS